MANDFKISDLIKADSAVDGDYLIINKGNSNTQSINVADMVSSNNLGFAPLFHSFTDSATGYTNPWVGNVQNLHSGGNVKTQKMPADADTALIGYTYTAKMWPPSNTTTESGPSFAQFGGSLVVTSDKGAVNVVNGCGTSVGNEICGGIQLMQAGIAMSQSSQSAENLSVTGNFIKYSLLQFPKGSNLTFTAQGILTRAKRTSWQKSAGRIMVFPFNSAAVDTFSMAAMTSMAGATDEESMPTPVYTGEAAFEDSKTVKAQLRYIIEVIKKTQEDPTWKGNSDSSIENAVQEALDKAFALKSATKLEVANFDAAQAEIDSIMAILLNPINEVAFSFAWESDYTGYNSSFTSFL